MVRRIIMGNDGGVFKFRASRPGVDAATAPFGNGFQIHEEMTPMAATESGEVAVAANSNVTINLTRQYDEPPLVLLNDGNGRVMGDYYWARYFIATNQLRIYNTWNSPMTVRWAVLADFFL